MLAQRTRLLINGSENSEINKRLKSFKYSDSIKGESDSCEMVLADDDHIFLNGGANLKGATMNVVLVKENAAFNVGIFEVDRVMSKSPPSECTLKLNSLPSGARARGVIFYDSWEETTLRNVAGDIAGKCGLSLFYDAEDHEIKRLEQEEGNLSFLKRISGNYGLSVKVHNRQLIIFDEKRYEAKGAAGSISIDDNRLISYSFDSTLTDIYGGAEVTFKSNNVQNWLWSLFGGRDLFKGSFTSAGKGGLYVINERVESEGAAEKLAQSKLREKNKQENKATLNMTGDFNLVSGNNMQLEGFGIHSGKYMIEKADHSISENGYTTNLQLHKCLGY